MEKGNTVSFCLGIEVEYGSDLHILSLYIT